MGNPGREETLGGDAALPGPEQLTQLLRGPDWSTLRWVAECRFVTAEIIAMLQFPRKWGVRLSQASLNRLWRAGLIASRAFSRQAATGAKGGGHCRRYWFLTPSGLGALASYLDVERERVTYTSYEPIMAPAEVKHRVAVSELRAALQHHARVAGGEVRHWFMEARLGKGLIADAVFTWQAGHVQRAYCVEVDRGTEPATRFAEKVEPYMKALAAKGWDPFADKQPLILVIVAVPGDDGLKRLALLRRAVARITDRRIMYFATAEQLYRIRWCSHGRYPEIDSNWDSPVALLNGRPDDDRRVLLTTEVVTNEGN